MSARCSSDAFMSANVFTVVCEEMMAWSEGMGSEWRINCLRDSSASMATRKKKEEDLNQRRRREASSLLYLLLFTSF